MNDRKESPQVVMRTVQMSSSHEVSMPMSLAERIEGYLSDGNVYGQSGAKVYRLSRGSDQAELYLKCGDELIADEITDEMARLIWLSKHAPVPNVIHFTRANSQAWLLMSALPGVTALEAIRSLPSSAESVVEQIAQFIRALHSIPTDTCPFQRPLSTVLLQARQRIDAGFVDVDDFDEERAGCSEEDVWQELGRALPLDADPVVVHGDFSLENIVVCEGRVIGCVDVGRLGVADRYQDVAITWNSLREFSPELSERFLSLYGAEHADRRKINFYLLLDELF